MTEEAGLLDGAVPPRENTVLHGHEEACSFLARAYRTGKIHHAVLIEGPQGIGKATLAFRFANHVLAHADPAAAPDLLGDPDPAGAIYRQIVSGASHHLIHLTRPTDEKTSRVKSAITVDEVRRIGRFFGQTSGTGNWRIVIIDPADDLNRAAANAVLKMLEEPPRNALFLVVSHAPRRLLPTIRSRCLPLRLHALSDRELEAALGHLGFSADQAGSQFDAVIARAGGSVARALMMLRYGGLDIAAGFDAVVRAGPLAGRADMHQLADTLAARDRDTAYQFFKETVAEWVEKRARETALGGNPAKGAELAGLASKIEQDLMEADAYNLDRKQTVLSVFSALFAGGAA